MVIALSDEWKQKFDDTFGLHNCVVLENGIDRERLLPAVSEPYQFRKSFLALGRLGKNKGTYDLVDAVEIARKNIPDLICYLAGDGEVDKFRSIVQERGLQKNIVVVGWVDFEKKLEILSKTATVVLPSYHEGLPMAILEGMACGKAIISTTVGAIPEVVTEKNGILIEPGDITALATALVEFCNNAERLRSISQNNIRKIDEEFSMSKMHERLQHYYEMCFNSK